MKHLIPALRGGLFSMALLVPCVIPWTVFADDATDLRFREVKVKGSDFAVIKATTALNLGQYWLGYSSSDSTAPPVPEYQLANVSLDKDMTALLVSDEAVPACDAAYVMDMPVTLAETKGILALWKQSKPDDKTLSFRLMDSVTWTTSKTGTADIVRPTGSEDGLILPTWFRSTDLTAPSSWQVADLVTTPVGCELRTKTGTAVQTITSVADSTPIVVATATTISNNDAVLADAPASSNEGLASPEITEILPNPSGTGTDASDEFIELYNPNSASFDLSGYLIRTGITTTHSYRIPPDTMIAPVSFISFRSAVTGLSLSNTTGQAALLDPNGMVLAQTDPYSSAPDGQAWALAGDEWSWTVSPTPDAANIITQPQVKAATSKAATKTVTLASATKKATTTKKATATKTTKTATLAAAKAATTKAAAALEERPTRGVHPAVLALVASAAVGYGLYEYRHDVANAFYKYRSNRATRRSARK